MEEAIKKLEELKAEYEVASQAMYMSSEYYERLKSKINAMEEAISRLRS